MEDRLEGKGWRQGEYIRDCWDHPGRRKLGQRQGVVSRQRCKYWEEVLRALGGLRGWDLRAGEKRKGRSQDESKAGVGKLWPTHQIQPVFYFVQLRSCTNFYIFKWLGKK